MQDIDVHSETKKLVVTLLVMRGFLVLPGASRACMEFRDPTAFSRLKQTLKVCVPVDCGKSSDGISDSEGATRQAVARCRCQSIFAAGCSVAGSSANQPVWILVDLEPI
jgi:hypothetical protein